MILIAILIALGMEKSLPLLHDYRQSHWFIDFVDWTRARLGSAGNGAFGVLLTIALPVAAVALVFYLLLDLLWLLAFIFGVLVLWFSLGPKNLNEEIGDYIMAREIGDSEARQRVGASILYEPIADSSLAPNRAITESILVQANERVLAVIFWFALLGPVGAALYRLTSILKSQTTQERETSQFARDARSLHAILDWLPTRLTALGYAISGSFVDAIGNWHGRPEKPGGKWAESNIEVLVGAGRGALQLDKESGIVEPEEGNVAVHTDEIKSARALVWRTLVVWIVVIALLTLAGWTA